MSVTKKDLSSYTIENVELWTPEGVTPGGTVTVVDGVLKGFGPNNDPDSVTRVSGRGYTLIPAGVDAQTHLRVPGQSQKERADTGLLAALKGGYCALLTMPNTAPTVDSLDVLERGQGDVAASERAFGVQVFWSAAITKRLNSDEPTDYESLARAGVRAFTNDGLGVASDEVMERAFSRLEKLNVPLLQHAEVAGHGGALAPGRIQRQLGVAPYPDAPEWQMVERDLRELRKHPGARYHVLHVSARKTLELVRAAKNEGLRVTAEVTPHHLYFNTDTIDGSNAAFKMNPPIRSAEDQEALWQALADGTLDFVATDHAPHEAVMKEGGFNEVAFGTLGLESALRVMISGWRQGRLKPERLVQVWATRPAEFLRLPVGLGSWTAGAPFHGVMVNMNAPEREYTLTDISSLSKNSCFLGTPLPGKIERAFHGRMAFEFH